jgi:hypothetical protein
MKELSFSVAPKSNLAINSTKGLKMLYHENYNNLMKVTEEIKN